MRSFALAFLLLALAACKPREAPRPEGKLAASLADRGFYGTIVPRKATALHAPPNVFRMKGWNSRSTNIKLISLVPDGSTVEKDQEVGRFEFNNEEALPWIKKRVAETKAKRDALTQNIAALAEQRQQYIEDALKKDASVAQSLDVQIFGAVKEQAAKKGLRYEEAPAH